MPHHGPTPAAGTRPVRTLLVTSLDAGGALDEVQELLGHASPSSTQVYLHPDPARLRAAVEQVPSPRLALEVGQ